MFFLKGCCVVQQGKYLVAILPPSYKNVQRR